MHTFIPFDEFDWYIEKSITIRPFDDLIDDYNTTFAVYAEFVREGNIYDPPQRCGGACLLALPPMTRTEPPRAGS